MPKPRKTVELKELKDLVNNHLGDKSEFSTPESRRAMANLLEIMLMRANAYKGFKYRYSEWDFTNPSYPQLKVGMDDTRREYY